MDVVDKLKHLKYNYITAAGSDPVNAPSYAVMTFLLQEAAEEIVKLRGSFQVKAIALMDKYEAATGENPNVIYIPKAIENEMRLLGYKHIAHLADTMLRDGVRKAFPTIYGMKVIWDAEEFKVGRA